MIEETRARTTVMSDVMCVNCSAGVETELSETTGAGTQSSSFGVDGSENEDTQRDVRVSIGSKQLSQVVFQRQCKSHTNIVSNNGEHSIKVLKAEPSLLAGV